MLVGAVSLTAAAALETPFSQRHSRVLLLQPQAKPTTAMFRHWPYPRFRLLSPLILIDRVNHQCPNQAPILQLLQPQLHQVQLCHHIRAYR